MLIKSDEHSSIVSINKACTSVNEYTMSVMEIYLTFINKRDSVEHEKDHAHSYVLC